MMVLVGSIQLFYMGPMRVLTVGATAFNPTATGSTPDTRAKESGVSDPRESDISIGDHPLTVGQSTAVRVAIQCLLTELEDEKIVRGIGHELAAGYRNRLTEVLNLMVEKGGLR